ncbi:MAG: hexosyltransferase [Isosphaeraceae bacterium]|nr:MAG: hexosyltransferase [Isosphaeraceae bacterium]
MHLAVCFTNFGPYHLARLRALGQLLQERGSRLSAVEVAGREERYPWSVAAGEEPFDWVRLFPGRVLETISGAECRRAILDWSEAARPDVFGIVGYSRPECMAALRWCKSRRRTAILLSESQAIDKPRVWWKEAVKARRVQRFSAALVGGPRHRDYLVTLGMPADRIALGYNAVDNPRIEQLATLARASRPAELPNRPYFLTVSRFVPEKNLIRLIRAYSAYRRTAEPSTAWDLALCGDGPLRSRVEAELDRLDLRRCVHLPGFLREPDLIPWYAHAGALVHPSLMEPWGLVVNEAAVCGLPLIVSDRCGCVETLVPEDGPERSGFRVDPRDEAALRERLAWMASAPPELRRRMGQRAQSLVAAWGPDRFAAGMLAAIERARTNTARGRGRGVPQR